MPILWIRQASPMTIEVEDDDGSTLNRMEVPGLDVRDSDWRIEVGEGVGRGRPFRMKRVRGSGRGRGRDDGEEHQLKIRIE